MISVIPVIQYVVMVDDLMKMRMERQLRLFDAGVRIAVSPSRGHLGRGSYDSAKRLLMECAKTLISTMLLWVVMQTTKTGTDKCKAGLYATLIIRYWAVVKR